MDDDGDMPIDLPVDQTTAWSIVGGNATKNKTPNGTQGQSSEKTTENGQVIGEFDNITSPSNQPRRNQSLYTTRINFKVIPSREIKTISVPLSICRIIAAIKAADKTARLISADDNANEIEFTGSANLQKDTEGNIEYVNLFIEQPKMNKSNQLVGLVVLRSDTKFGDIKKHQLTQKGLNEYPRIFLTANNLDVITPTTVGFFVNTMPRADKPETFNARFSKFMNQHNPRNIKYQIEFGPIWAPHNRISTFKLMTAFEDKDATKAIMDQYVAGSNGDAYVCMTEYSSLPDAQKVKILQCQADYVTKHRSLFIEGYKSIHGKLRPDDKTHDSPDHESVAHWIFARPTSYDNRMFTRVYPAENGVVELHAKKENIKEATDWARLAMREIAAQTDEVGMTEIFNYPEEALDAMETMPAWKPHSLSAKVDLLPDPCITAQQRRNRRIVNLGYEKANTMTKDTTAKTRKKSGKSKASNKNTNDTPNKSTTHPAWSGYGPPGIAAAINRHSDTNDDEAASDADEDMEILDPIPATHLARKQGVNKYKAAAEETEKRLWKLEEGLLKLTDHQTASNTNIMNLAQEQRNIASKVGHTAENIDKLAKAVMDNKIDANKKHEANALATQLATEKQDNTYQLMKALDSSMNNMRQLMIDMESRMKPLPESPVRKKQANSLPTPPKNNRTVQTNTLPEVRTTWEKYYDEEGSIPPPTEASHLKNHRSDVDMEGAAEEN